MYRAAAVADERTLILVKPDAFERRLTGEVIARFERKGLSLVALKLMRGKLRIDGLLTNVATLNRVTRVFSVQ